MSKKKVPEFKPGDKPYLKYDGMMLNANVPWNEVVTDILSKNVTVQEIAEETGLTEKMVKNVQQKNYDGLTFKAGARIITIHSRVFAEQYGE